MTNLPNKWAKTRKSALIVKVSPTKHGCQHRGCKEKRPSRLEFSHIRQTPLSRIGPRGRKEKWADINKHPKSYRVKCHKHHMHDKADVKHDKRMRRLGHR